MDIDIVCDEVRIEAQNSGSIKLYIDGVDVYQILDEIGIDKVKEYFNLIENEN